jgi:hypothetical protein
MKQNQELTVESPVQLNPYFSSRISVIKSAIVVIAALTAKMRRPKWEEIRVRRKKK